MVKKFKNSFIEIIGAIGVFIFQIKLRKVLKKSSDHSGEFVYIWIPPRLQENLGDLGMASVCEEFYKDGKVVYISNNPSILGFKTQHEKVYFNHQKDQGNLFASLRQHHCKRLIIVGADTLDGAYGSIESIFKLTTAWNFQRSSVQTNLVNLSWNAQNLSFFLKIALAFANSGDTKFITRDAVSFSRLQAKGLNPILSSDLVFNLKLKTNLPLQQNFENWKSFNSAIVAVGFGIPVGEAINYLDQMVEVCRHLLGNSYSILLAPSESSKSNIDLNLALVSTLNSEKVFFYQDISSNYEFAELLSKAEFGITNRMHFAIHALLAHIPAIGVEYQGKFEGLYNFLEMQDLKLQGLSEISAAIGPLIDELPLYKKKIAKSLPRLIELSTSNFR